MRKNSLLFQEIFANRIHSKFLNGIPLMPIDRFYFKEKTFILNYPSY